MRVEEIIKIIKKLRQEYKYADEGNISDDSLIAFNQGEDYGYLSALDNVIDQIKKLTHGR